MNPEPRVVLDADDIRRTLVRIAHEIVVPFPERGEPELVKAAPEETAEVP